MKNPLLNFLIAVVICALFLSVHTDRKFVPRAALRNSAMTFCSSFLEYLDTVRPAELHEGLGDLHRAITTTVPQAQKFFDQGLRLIYAFNHAEAHRSFVQAARIDPSCAMAYWGQALALGPNINDWNPQDREAMALKAISSAKKFQSVVTAKEKEFIHALAVRYDGKAHSVRDTLNAAYRLSMEALAKKYPDDPEALTLYADAIMTSIPWNYWNPDGSPLPLTLDARKALEAAIQKFPKHPGAHHMYIHLVEASRKPGDALKSAAFLEAAMPSAGHLVHMPAHIYVRVGQYGASNAANIRAISADEEFLPKTDDQGMYRNALYPHNIDFLSFGYLMDGQSSKSLEAGRKLVYQTLSIEDIMPVYYDYFAPTPIITFIRYGQWNEILALSAPTKRFYQTSAMHYFGRGLAFLRKGRVDAAETELKELERIHQLDTIKTIYAFFNSTHQIVSVATEILRGEVLLAKGKKEEGFAALRSAIIAEDNLRYNEPPDWRLPARHYLGAALLESGKAVDAEKVFLEDLQRNPENGWALQGLMQSQEKLGKSKEAGITTTRFQKVWKSADVKISSSRF